MSKRSTKTCAALVPSSSGSWFDFSGCLNGVRDDVTPVVEEDGFYMEVKLCGTHRRMIEDGKKVDVHDGTYSSYTDRPNIVTVRKPEQST